MSGPPPLAIRAERAFGDRWAGVVAKPGHALEGAGIAGEACFSPAAKAA